MDRWRRVTAMLTLACAVGMSVSTRSEVRSAVLRARGNDLEYNLDLEPALDAFRQDVDAAPNDPAGYRAVAAVYLFEIAYRRGTVTVDDFLGDDVAADSVQRAKPPVELASAFHTNAQHALALAEQQLRAHPDDADVHYQVGTTIGLLASYSATVDGQVFGAFKFARRAYSENSRALELDPKRKDAALIVGTYQYIVSTRSFPVRWLARLAGLDGNKTHGLNLIESAARYPGENQTDAQFALVLIYNRERRYDDALAVLTTLQSRYPRNRLLWLEAGATALRGGRFEEAARYLDAGFAKLSADPRPPAFGEAALWRYKRGAILARLQRTAEAASDLRDALTGDARDWVRGRAHAELGKLADLAGDHRAARLEYQTAVRLAKADDDSIGVAEAERLLSGSASHLDRN